MNFKLVPQKIESEVFASTLKPIADHISKLTGVQLGKKQESQVRSRIAQRMRVLGIANEKEYVKFFEKNKDSESEHLVSLLTTHYTFFFREFAHFEYIVAQLPAIVKRLREKGRKKIRIWSAAASTGQEAYSLAMLLNKHLPTVDPEFDFEIYGTDVDPKSVAIANNGVYRWNEIKSAPATYISGHWVRGTKEIQDFVKAKKTIREKVRFDAGNLITLPRASAGTDRFDIIFCRNVFIYFSMSQIKSVVQNLMTYLNEGGFLITGLSESLGELNLPLHHEGKSIYFRENERVDGVILKGHDQVQNLPSPQVRSEVHASVVRDKPIRVLCVDDSASVITILKKVLSTEEGFGVVGVARNGEEAIELSKKIEYDVMTLDIHMPKISGVEYLKSNYRKSHPPVIIVSSVRREDSDLAMQALQCGAFDYIEKPSLSNFTTVGEEIKSKLKFAMMATRSNLEVDHKLDQDFSQKISIPNPEQKVRAIYGSVPDLRKMAHLLKESNPTEPPTMFFLAHAGELLDGLREKLSLESGKRIEICDGKSELVPGHVYIADLKERNCLLKSAPGTELVHLVFASLSREAILGLNLVSRDSIVLEEIGPSHLRYFDEIVKIADFIVPYTSMAYEGDRIFASLDGVLTP